MVGDKEEKRYERSDPEMQYVIMDLEWNQSTDPEQTKENLPFEIIEIGAVKLNENLEQEDTFHRYIKPICYLELAPVVERMLPYNERNLEHGESFVEVMNEFFNWCGNNYIFCTYGDSDLIQLQRNMDYYHMPRFKKPLAFYDVQRIYRFWHQDKGVVSLEHAVSTMGIEVSIPFHQALYDAFYTAQVFRRIEREKWIVSIDVYNNPKNAKEEIFRKNKKGTLYITREFVDKVTAMEQRKVKNLRCACCGAVLRQKIHWFASSLTVYYAVGYCEQHGYMRGKIKVKNAINGKIFLIKTVKPIQKSEAESIELRQEELRKKRRERKKRVRVKE